MSGHFYSVIYIIVFILAITSMVSVLYNGVKMFGHMKPSARKWANYLPFIIPFLVSSYSEDGHKYIARWLISLIFVGVSILGLTLMEDNYGKPPYMEPSDHSNQVQE